MKATAAGETVEARRERFVRLTTPHLEALFRTALYMTGRRERAEDAVQEAILRAWRYFDTFAEGREARVWLYAILRNVVYEAARKRRREPQAASLDEVGAENVAGRDAAAPGARLTDQEIQAAIAKLPEEFREVVLLAVVEEMKYREIAEALGIPMGTVMSRLYRGRRLLQAALRDYGDERGQVA